MASYLAAFDFIESLDRQSTVEGLVEAFDALLRKFGFVAFAVGNPIAPKLKLEERVLVATWPKEWTDLWLKRNYVAVDPVVYQMLAQPVPFRWRDVRQRASGAGAQVMDSARDFLFYDGIGIPVRSDTREIMGITMAGPECAVSKREEMCLHLAAIYFHARLEKLKATAGPSGPALTERERECLAWAAAGKTDWEISQILSIAEQTAKQHMKNAMRKLNALHRAQAVALAIHKGFIAP